MSFVKIAGPDAADAPEPFRFELAGRKFELPSLSEKTAPLELIPVLALAADDQADEKDMLQAGIVFFEYLKTRQPKLWRHINAQPAAIEWLNGLMEAWVKHSGVDPKAESSS